MDSLTIKAYAKINLYLDVTGKLPDGYHTLETVMHSISLHDTVTVSKAESGVTVTCSDPDIPDGSGNIAYKCAESFFTRTGIEGEGVSIHIEKSIPSQAGMGGGSADGAAVLRGMNTLFEGGLSLEELCALGGSLGADIPFCIIGGCGYCTNFGDVIESLPPLSGIVLIGKGRQGISTREAFEKIDSVKGIGLKNVRDIFAVAKSFSDIAPYCRNLFDEVTELGEVSEIKALMNKNGAVCSAMTGSGSAVFGLFDNKVSAEKAAEILDKKGFFSKLCKFTH